MASDKQYTPKACPHNPVEHTDGWTCTVCGARLLTFERLGFWDWRARRRDFRRALDEWRNG